MVGFFLYLQDAGDGGPEDWKPKEGDTFRMQNMWKPDPMLEGLQDAHPLDKHEENVSVSECIK